MDLEIVILGEASQTAKNKYPMISLICGIFFYKTVQINVFIKQKQTYRLGNKLLVATGEGEGGG